MDKQPEEPQQRIAPIFHSEHYLAPIDNRSITPAEKKEFLELYYQSGNMSMAAKKVGRDNSAFRLCMVKDKAFKIDFTAVKEAMKHNLEQTMYTNGLKEKGYMDRITWLRRNFPQEYNPNFVEKSTNPTEAIKELSDKLEDYQLIPKKNIVEVKEDKNATEERE